MKRLSRYGVFVALASVMTGCPLWDEDQSRDDFGCFGADCFDPSGPDCTASAQCGLNETCGSDGQCHPGDCTHWGCFSGECSPQDDGTVSCGDGSGPGGGQGGQGGGGGGAGGDGGSGVVYCGNPDDCGIGETCGQDGTCQPGDCSAVPCIFGFVCDVTAAPPECKPENPAACGSDADCAVAGAGYACVSGICTAPEDQCFDQGQCDDAGKCVEGKCTASCNDDGDCPTGYSCDAANSICGDAVKPCAITNDCGGPDDVCVDGACVPRAVGGECPVGSVWVENGCISDQTATFTCTVDGAQDACAAGSLCLHHSCYISCEPPNENACINLPTLNVCKAVTTTSGAHQVCGSNENLGSECDPQAGVACTAGKICIDGYCK